MSGYTNRFTLLQFPELGDRVSVLLRNPRLLPPEEITPKDVAVDANGQPLDPQAATQATFEVMARLIVAWHAYDASIASSAISIDLDADNLDEQLAAVEAADQVRLGEITAESVAKLPTAMIKRITEELERVADPS